MGNRTITNFSTYEASFVAAAAADNAAIAQFYYTSTLGYKWAGGLVRLSVTLLTAVATRVALVIPSTKGTASVTQVLQHVSWQGTTYSNPFSGVLLATAWSAAPTYNTGLYPYQRQEHRPATIGERFEWTWPEDNPLMCGMERAESGGVLNNGLVLRNVTGGVSAQLLISARYKVFAPIL